IRGFIGVGVVALAMSTADSYLNASAVLLANDVIKPLNINVNSEVRTARILCVLSGLLALFLALYSSGILESLMLVNSFYMPVVTVPLLLAIFGFRSSKRTALGGMAAGFVTVVLWSIFGSNADSILPGMLANVVVTLAIHYLLGEEGGWQPVAPDSALALERAARRRSRRRLMNDIKTFRLYTYLKQNLPEQEMFYFLFGLYTIAATYTAFYTIGDSSVQSYQRIYEGIYHAVPFATTIFLTFPIWPPVVKNERFIALFWPLGISAILFFAGTLLVIMSHFHHMQIMVLMINFLITVLLLRWPLAFIVALSGMGLAVVFFEQYTGLPIPYSEATSLQFRLLYGLLLFTGSLIALFSKKVSLQRNNA
ncbi:MAG: hypothetical protein AAFQ01_03085, partial [Bacteroidota bacterium]